MLGIGHILDISYAFIYGTFSEILRNYFIINALVRKLFKISHSLYLSDPLKRDNFVHVWSKSNFEYYYHSFLYKN